MSDARPYIEHCSFCDDGLLRFWRCRSCDQIVAMCDECELMWSEIAEVAKDPNLPSDSQYPQCPACGEWEAAFDRVSMEEIEENDLYPYTAGESI